ncbi:MAG: dctD [Planctomycetaceae bacterium]|nr:dctD [Planctomycetaceae bacterium]
MSRLFGSADSTCVSHAERRKLLVKASLPERWFALLQSVAAEWNVTWALDDEQFAVALAQGEFAVAALEASDRRTAVSPLWESTGQETFESVCPPPHYSAASQTKSFPSTTFLLLQGDDTDHVAAFKRPSHECQLLAEIRPQTSANEFKRWLDTAYGLSQMRAENLQLQRRLANRRSPIIGNSAQIERLREQIATSAVNDWPILIQGEPGTGRDLVARAIHEASERAHRPFVKIDCRVHSSTSLGRELFGQAVAMLDSESSVTFPAGVYHGGSEFRVSDQTSVPGRIDLADGGMLVIDGIDEIALPLQAILAQVLEKKLFQRMGERTQSPLNVRVIAVTSKDLFQLSETGQFREDLLRHFPGPVIKTPVLREIRSDIVPLAEHLLHRISARLASGPIRLLVDSATRLQAHDWPGNVSELESLLERSCTLNPCGKLTVDMIETWLADEAQFSAIRVPGMTLIQMERQLIEATFARCAGNRELTAQSLQIGLRTLSGKLREYGYPPRGGPGSNRQFSQGERDAA